MHSYRCGAALKRRFKYRRAQSHGAGVVQVEWTQELHDRFVCAVETLGTDKAVPSKILDHMGPIAAGLTRQNVASHLQKYRKRHSAQSDFCKAAAYCPPAAYPCWSPFATPYMMGAPSIQPFSHALPPTVGGTSDPLDGLMHAED